MLRIGAIPMPPARNTAGRVISLWSVKAPPWTADDEPGAKSGSLQCALEGSLAHAHRDHNRLFVHRGACDREGPRIVALATEDKVGMLTSPEFVAGAICVKPKRHRVPGDSLSIHQCHVIFSHEWSSV